MTLARDRANEGLLSAMTLYGPKLSILDDNCDMQTRHTWTRRWTHFRIDQWILSSP